MGVVRNEMTVFKCDIGFHCLQVKSVRMVNSAWISQISYLVICLEDFDSFKSHGLARILWDLRLLLPNKFPVGVHVDNSHNLHDMPQHGFPIDC